MESREKIVAAIALIASLITIFGWGSIRDFLELSEVGRVASEIEAHENGEHDTSSTNPLAEIEVLPPIESQTTTPTTEQTITIPLEEPPTLSAPSLTRLVDIRPFTSTHNLHLVGSLNADNFGNRDFETGFRFHAARSPQAPVNREFVYILNRDYNKFTGIISVDTHSRDRTHESNFFIMTVYGDGNPLYSTESIRGGVRPISFNIPIDGVDELKIIIKMSGVETLGDFTVLLLDPHFVRVAE